MPFLLCRTILSFVTWRGCYPTGFIEIEMRLDVYLTRMGIAESRTRAERLIENGTVLFDGRQIKKPGFAVDDTVSHDVSVTGQMPYVGRGGLKLEAALDAFHIDPADAWAVDVGASTGGFTDCLLSRGAARCFAVDSGAGQLAEKLRRDERVVLFEHCNARYLTPEALGADFCAHGGADIVVMDVSFISATCILPVFPALLKAGGRAVVLIKPQFEVGRAYLGKGGIVKDGSARKMAVGRVVAAAEAAGMTVGGVIDSPIEGGDGNREFLCMLKKSRENQNQ